MKVSVAAYETESRTLQCVRIQCTVADVTWRRSRPVLLSLGTTLTSEVVAGYMGYGYRTGRMSAEGLDSVRVREASSGGGHFTL